MMRNKYKFIAMALFLIMSFAMFAAANPAGELLDKTDDSTIKDTDKNETVDSNEGSRDEQSGGGLISLVDRNIPNRSPNQESSNEKAVIISDLTFEPMQMEINDDIPTFLSRVFDNLNNELVSGITVNYTHDIDNSKVGSYVVRFTVNGQTFLKTFTVIDSVAPVIDNLVVSPKRLTKNDVVSSWDITETGSGIKTVQRSFDNINWFDLNETEFYGLTFTAEYKGKVYIRAIDNADNISNVVEIRLNIDKTAPTGVFTYSNKTGRNYRYTNRNVTVTLKTDEPIQHLKGWRRVNSQTFTRVFNRNTTGKITIKDYAGNETKLTYDVRRIDKVAPTIRVINSTGNNRTKLFSRLNFSFADNTVLDYYILNNKRFYIRGNQSTFYLNFFSIRNYLKEGRNQVKVYDKAGNSATYIFTYDSIAPTGEFTYSNKPGRNYRYTNEDVLVTLKTNEPIKRLSGWTRVNSTTFTRIFTKNTTGQITIEDLAGNKTNLTYRVRRIDKVAPTIRLNNFEGSKEDNVFRKLNFTLRDNEALDRYIINGKTVRFRGNVTQGNLYFNNIKDSLQEGLNTLTVFDKAGNSRSYTFIYDITSPTITAYLDSSNTIKVADGQVLNHHGYLNINIQDANIGKFYINDVEYPQYEGDSWFNIAWTIKTDGPYTLKAVDKAGNESTLTFIYDSTLPTITAYLDSSNTIEVTDGQVLNHHGYLNINIQDANIGKFYINDVEYTQYEGDSWFNIAWTIKTDGIYTLKSVDKAGNESTLTFTYDSTAPTAIVTIDSLNPSMFNLKASDLNGPIKVSYTIYPHPAGDSKALQSGWIVYEGQNSIDEDYLINDLPAGDYTLRVSVRDVIDNVNHLDWIHFKVESVLPEVTINVSDVVDGKFTVSGTALAEERLNRVYVQLVSRETNNRCGGTTVHLLDPVQASANWSVSYDIKDFDSTLCPEGYYAAHVEVVDIDNNRATAGWTDNFLVEMPDTDDEPENKMAVKLLHYKRDDGIERAWKTGTSKDNPTTTMDIKFKVESSLDLDMVGVLWSNEYKNFKPIEQALKDNSNLATPLVVGSDGYYRTSSPEGIEGRYLAAIVAVDINGTIYVYSGYAMYFKKPDLEITPPELIKGLFNIPEYLPSEPTTPETALKSLRASVEILKPDEIVEIKYAWTEIPIYADVKKGKSLDQLKDFSIREGNKVTTDSLTGVEGGFYLTVYAKNIKGQVQAWGGNKVYIKLPDPILGTILSNVTTPLINKEELKEENALTTQQPELITEEVVLFKQEEPTEEE